MLKCDEVLTKICEEKLLESYNEGYKKEKMHIILYKGICDDYVKKVVIGLLAGIISGFLVQVED